MVVGIVAGEFEELFEELFFGAGSWFGLIIILAFALIVSFRVKYSGVVWTIVLLFITLEYLANVPESSNFMWSAVATLVSMCLIGWHSYTEIRG